ncbi:hypothetical protein FNH09_05735 [Streptomyces adustus]|uniref:Uncharacterized protein n=1 Tax=Streptomyces adustus TaxID=1609272 RepID=A0A5N8V6V8_9ACTN|nr:hypothetical protein [Streptomyces adustus]MPY30829.1 hypothetical protein [Streptomyces adustus]
MIKQVSHPVAGIDAAGFALALEVAYELNAPSAPTLRAPEVAPQLMGLRVPADRPHRRKVPLKRLTAVRG